MSRLKLLAVRASIVLLLLSSGAVEAQTAPTITLAAVCTAPCNAPAAITLTATATVASGRTVSKVEFYEGTTLLATDTSSPYSSARAAVAGGAHSYTAKVYDSGATPLTATSAAIVVAVNTAPTETLTAACTAPCTAPASVLLTAMPTDSDGSIGKVEFYRGATLINTRTAAPWTYSDASLAAGSYSYTAKAFDNGITPLTVTSAAQAVTVAVAPPTVTLTAACTAPCNAPAAITLTATTTVASGRSVSKVEFYEGATLLATDTTSPYSTARTAVAGGSHSYTAKVYDSAATPLTTTSTAVIVPVNTAPTVTLTAVCTASPCSAPATVTLTSTPADPDGTISKVEFYRGTTLISTKTAAPWTYSDAALIVGNYSYTAKAFDNGSTPLNTTSAAQAISVVAAVAPPTAALTVSCTAPCNAPAAITLTAATTVASGRTVSKVEFYEGATLLATDTTSPYSTARTAVAGGSHSYTAKVYDSAATPLTAISTAVVVSVNTAPSVTLSAVCVSPCGAPAAVTLTATPTDSDGSISKVEFYRGATLINTRTAAPWTYSDASLAAGSYSYTAKAFDNATTPLTATSTAQAISVAAVVTAPTVTLTAICTSPCTAPATVALKASTTVSSGRYISKVEYYDGATLISTITSTSTTTNSFTLNYSGVTAGSHSFTAKVYDNASPPLSTVSAAATMSTSVSEIPIVIDGPEVTVVFPAAAAPQLKFSAKAGDIISLRVTNYTSPTPPVRVAGCMTPPLNARYANQGPIIGTPLLLTAVSNGYSDACNLIRAVTIQSQYGFGYIDMFVLTDGDYVVKLSDFGSFSQSVKFALFRAADAGLVAVDGAPVAVSTTRLGQAVQFKFSAPTNLVPLACRLSDSASGYPVAFTDSVGTTWTYGTVMLLSRTGRLVASPLLGSSASPCLQLTTILGSTDLPESGPYTLIISPNDAFTTRTTLTLATPQAGPTLVVNAAPTEWPTSPQFSAGIRVGIPVVAGHEYSFVLSDPDNAILPVYREFPVYFEPGFAAPLNGGVLGGQPLLRNELAQTIPFTAATTGTIWLTLVENRAKAGRLLMSVVENFNPTAVFTDPTANKMYKGASYFNGITIAGNGTVAVKLITVLAHEFGQTNPGDARWVGYAGPFPHSFRWAGESRDPPAWPLPPQSIYARVRFINDIEIRTPLLPLSQVSPPSLILDPAYIRNGITVDDDQISFQGNAATGGANVGVLVNDVRVPVVLAGDFAVNNVPLAVGTNTLTFAVHQLSGTQNYSYTINRAAPTGPKNFNVTMQPDWGTTVVTPTITIANLSGAPWQRAEIQLPDDTPPIVLLPQGPNAVSTSFRIDSLNFGHGYVRSVQITVFDANNQALYRATRFVTSIGAYDSANGAKAAFSHVQSNISSGNVAGALQAFTDESLAKFTPLFQAFGASLSNIGALGEVISWSVSGQRAELVVRRLTASGAKLFRVTLMRDRFDGLWRIEDM